MESPTAGMDRSADELVSAVLTASRVLVAVSARSLAQVEERVTLTQFRALVVLSGGEGRTNLNRLADALAVTPSTALRTVDRLVAAGLATRQENAENRREVLLGLTVDGQRIVRDVTSTRREEIAAILAADVGPETRRAGRGLPRVRGGRRRARRDRRRRGAGLVRPSHLGRCRSDNDHLASRKDHHASTWTGRAVPHRPAWTPTRSRRPA